MRWIAFSYNVLNFHFPLAALAPSRSHSRPSPGAAVSRRGRFFLFYRPPCVRECVGGKAAERSIFRARRQTEAPQVLSKAARCSAFSLILGRLWCALGVRHSQQASAFFPAALAPLNTCTRSPRDFSVFGAWRASVCFVFGCQHETNTHARGCRWRGELVLWAFGSEETWLAPPKLRQCRTKNVIEPRFWLVASIIFSRTEEQRGPRFPIFGIWQPIFAFDKTNVRKIGGAF